MLTSTASKQRGTAAKTYRCRNACAATALCSLPLLAGKRRLMQHGRASSVDSVHTRPAVYASLLQGAIHARYCSGIVHWGSRGSHASTCRWQRWSPGLCGKRGKSATTSAATASLLVENVCWPAPRNRKPSARLTWGQQCEGRSGSHSWAQAPDTRSYHGMLS